MSSSSGFGISIGGIGYKSKAALPNMGDSDRTQRSYAVHDEKQDTSICYLRNRWHWSHRIDEIKSCMLHIESI